MKFYEKNYTFIPSSKLFWMYVLSRKERIQFNKKSQLVYRKLGKQF